MVVHRLCVGQLHCDGVREGGIHNLEARVLVERLIYSVFWLQMRLFWNNFVGKFYDDWDEICGG